MDVEKNICHLCDCMDFMKGLPDNAYDLAIVDPPYGLGEDGGICRSSYVRQKNGNRIFVRGDYPKRHWDKSPPPPEYFKELFRISKDQIIWGANNYLEQFGPGRIVWDKCNDGSSQSDCEIAYYSVGRRVDCFRYMWRGMMQGKSLSEGDKVQSNKQLNEKRIHPTQKPVALYKWLLQNYAKPGQTIFDSHVGSGSIRIACYDLGFDFEGCEIDEDYWEAQEARFNTHQAQGNLFETEELQHYNQSKLFKDVI